MSVSRHDALHKTPSESLVGAGLSQHRLRSLGTPVVSILAVALLAACSGKPIVTEFPPGLEARPATEAEWPAAEDGGPREELVLKVGTSDTGVAWVHTRGYLMLPIEDLAAALSDPDVVSDRREIDEWTVELGVEPEYPNSFRVHAIVHRLITVEFDVVWRQGPSTIDGRIESWVANYQKTTGTEYIEILRGSIVLVRIDDDTTSVEIVSELKAVQGGEEEVRAYVQDLVESLRAKAEGRPIPEYP